LLAAAAVATSIPKPPLVELFNSSSLKPLSCSPLKSGGFKSAIRMPWLAVATSARRHLLPPPR
jgi:hypothetical protein